MAEAGITFKADNGREFTTDQHGYIQGEVKVGIGELIDVDLEGALDLFSGRLTGSDLLMDLSYVPVSVEAEEISVLVTGDPSMILEMKADDEEEELPGPAA